MQDQNIILLHYHRFCQSHLLCGHRQFNRQRPPRFSLATANFFDLQAMFSMKWVGCFFSQKFSVKVRGLVERNSMKGGEMTRQNARDS